MVVIGVLAMLLSVSAMACSGLMSQTKDTSGYKLTGGVAAPINGTNLTEDTVTKQIMSCLLYTSPGGPPAAGPSPGR